MPDLDYYVSRRLLHTRLVRACERVMVAGDITEQVVAEALGKRPGQTQFDVYGITAALVVDAGKLIGLAHERWSGFVEPPELVTAIGELIDAIDELMTG